MFQKSYYSPNKPREEIRKDVETGGFDPIVISNKPGYEH